MKRFVLCLMIVLLLASVVYAESFKNEPDGFRGIAWGTDISTLSGMKRLSTDPVRGLDVYERKGDKLIIGIVKLDSIRYTFWHGRLCSILIKFSGPVNWLNMQRTLFERFGDGSSSTVDWNTYTWSGDKTHIWATAGMVHFSSRAITDDIDAYNRQKAKEGAASGF